MSGRPGLLRRLGTAWVSRAAHPDPSAVAAVTGLTPAVVVTGASEGIGRALALVFGRRAEALVLVARRQDALDAVAREIAATHPSTRVVTVAVDLTSEQAADAIASSAAAHGLYVDEVVNNAGVGLGGPFTEQPAEDVAGLVALNVAAVTRLMRHFLPDMLRRGRGGVLNISSLGGYAPGPYQAAYYASKAYVQSLSRAVAYEARGRGVRVAVASPGPVETSFHARMKAEGAFYRRLLPSPSAETVARAIVRGYDAGLGSIHPGPLTSAAAVAMTLVPGMIMVPIIGWLLWPRRFGR
jgi:short-subunit dehydrogenase